MSTPSSNWNYYPAIDLKNFIPSFQTKKAPVTVIAIGATASITPVASDAISVKAVTIELDTANEFIILPPKFLFC